MKAICVIPGTPNSVHLRDVAKPKVSDIPNGRGVLVKVLRVGVDGTDKEINAAEYGAAPPGYDYLITGHESFGIIEEVGENVTVLKQGDYVVATVRRPGGSLYDKIGTYDTFFCPIRAPISFDTRLRWALSASTSPSSLRRCSSSFSSSSMWASSPAPRVARR